MKKVLFCIVFIICSISTSLSQSSNGAARVLDSLVEWRWYPYTNQLELYEKRLYTYYSDSNLREETLLTRDLITNKWDSTDKFDYLYDNNDSLIEKTTYSWSGSWAPRYKYEYTYNTDRLLIKKVRLDYLYALGQFVQDNKEEYFYDTNFNLTSRIVQSWYITTNLWVNSSQTLNTYDANNNLTQEISMFWNTSSGQWINGNRKDYSYTTNQKLDTLIMYNWLSNTNLWQLQGVWEYSYNTDGQLILVTMRIANQQQLTAVEKFQRTYDSFDNLEKYHIYRWSEADTSWIPTNVYDYSYNNDFAFEDLVIPFTLSSNFSYPINFSHMLLESKNSFWNASGSYWVDLNRVLFYFSDQINSVSQVPVKPITVYPNPFTGEIIFELTGETYLLELFNAQGVLVYREKISNFKRINLQFLSHGLYFYRLSDSRSTQFKGKLIKQ